MERLSGKHDSIRFTRSTVHFIGLILMALGVLSRGLIQFRVLGIGSSSSQDLSSVLDMSGGMTAATTALILQALESCAVPIFSALLIDGFLKTRNCFRYFLRLLALAAVCEIPYNFALSASICNPASRNPIFGMAVCLAVLFFYQHYEGMSLKNIAVKFFVFLSAFLWSVILRAQYSVMLLVLVTVLWAFRSRPTLRYLLGAAAAICFSAVDPLTMLSPFGFLLVFYYGGEKGTDNRLFHYALYPLILILTGIAGALLF